VRGCRQHVAHGDARPPAGVITVEVHLVRHLLEAVLLRPSHDGPGEEGWPLLAAIEKWWYRRSRAATGRLLRRSGEVEAVGG
jgi:hypothetical protein